MDARQISIGDPCSSTQDPSATCPAGASCVFARCRQTCFADGDCPTDSICIGDGQAQGCRLGDEATCSVKEPCSSGLLCGSDMSCRVPCNSNQPCPTADQECFDGTCRRKEIASCVGIGQACNKEKLCCSGAFCSANGFCEACGQEGQPCCDGAACSSGLQCNTLSGEKAASCRTCGGDGLACCSGACIDGLQCLTLDGGAVCQGGGCGKLKQTCCEGACDQGLRCDIPVGYSSKICTDCGSKDNRCCAGKSTPTCNAGLSCSLGKNFDNDSNDLYCVASCGTDSSPCCSNADAPCGKGLGCVWDNFPSGPRCETCGVWEYPYPFVLPCCRKDTDCKDTCATANNSKCEDGRPGAVSSACAHGTDCTDCAPDACGPGMVCDNADFPLCNDIDCGKPGKRCCWHALGSGQNSTCESGTCIVASGGGKCP